MNLQEIRHEYLEWIYMIQHEFFRLAEPMLLNK